MGRISILNPDLALAMAMKLVLADNSGPDILQRFFEDYMDQVYTQDGIGWKTRCGEEQTEQLRRAFYFAISLYINSLDEYRTVFKDGPEAKQFEKKMRQAVQSFKLTIGGKHA